MAELKVILYSAYDPLYDSKVRRKITRQPVVRSEKGPIISIGFTTAVLRRVCCIYNTYRDTANN